MGEKELILKRVSGPEDRLLVSKVLDKAEISDRTGRLAWNQFRCQSRQALPPVQSWKLLLLKALEILSFQAA